MAANEETEEVEKRIKKKFVNPSGIPPVFSNDMTISHTEREFFLSFYQTEPPIVMSAEDIAAIDTINANLISKIIVTPEFAESIMKAMQTNIENYKKSKKDDKE